MILVTGARGHVGGLLLTKLAAEHPDCVIYGLTRQKSVRWDLPNVRPVIGDVTLQGLGLRAEVYGELCRTVHTVVHCAAATKFTLPLEQARAVNVQGTANVVQLARDARRLRLLLHVSSTYVAGRRPGPLREQLLRDPEGWFSGYEQSKFEAEGLIAGMAAGLPWAIARLSTLVGDSRTGRVSQFNYFHQLLRLVPRNLLPVIPGTPESLVDVVADDWVTEALYRIVRAGLAPGRVLHLCAGPLESMTAGEVLDLAFAEYRREHSEFRGIPPAFVSAQEFGEFAAKLRREGQEALWRMSELLSLYLPHLEVHQPFLNQTTNALLAREGLDAGRPPEFLLRVVRQCWTARGA